MPKSKHFDCRWFGGNAIVKMIMDASQVDTAHIRELCVTCMGANGRLRGNELESSLKLFDESERCFWTIRVPPLGRFPNGYRRAGDDSNG